MRILRSAGGFGFNPLASSFAITNRSIGFFTHQRFLTAGSDGRRTGLKAQWAGSVGCWVLGVGGHTAPSFTHSVKSLASSKTYGMDSACHRNDGARAPMFYTHRIHCITEHPTPNTQHLS